MSVAEHLHNLSPYSLHGMVQVSAEALHAILCSLSLLGSFCLGLACSSTSYHALTVSAEAWPVLLYLIMPWQYPHRLGMLFYILSLCGSIRTGLACFSISYHALTVSAEAWHALLYLPHLSSMQSPTPASSPLAKPPTSSQLFRLSPVAKRATASPRPTAANPERVSPLSSEQQLSAFRAVDQAQSFAFASIIRPGPGSRLHTRG